MLLLPRLPQDLLPGCRPFHVHDCVDFTLGLPLASIEEGAFEGGLTSAIPGIMGILLTSTDFSVSNCCKHLLEQIKDWANKKWHSSSIFNYLFLAVEIAAYLLFWGLGDSSSDSNRLSSRSSSSNISRRSTSYYLALFHFPSSRSSYYLTLFQFPSSRIMVFALKAAQQHCFSLKRHFGQRLLLTPTS